MANIEKMRRIQLKELHLVNFKGIKDLSIDFEGDTAICGDNATGKTTVFDAFTWLLFGKDSTDRKDFEIKTLDSRGNVIPKIEHEVSAIILEDDHQISLRRVFREKWVKKRGEATSEFTGNETLYYYQDVPLQQQEYQAKISKLLDEGIFKLITNTLYFNNLKWQDRRQVLIQIAGDVSDADIAEGNPEFERLLRSLSGKDLGEYRREIAERKKKLKADLVTIPVRIDEVKRGTPQRFPAADIKEQLQAAGRAYIEVDGLITNQTKVSEKHLSAIREKQKSLHNLKTRLADIAHQVRARVSEQSSKRDLEIKNIQFDISSIQSEISLTERAINQNTIAKEDLSRQLDSLREKWTEINSSELFLDPHDFNCPVCKQPLPADTVERKREDLVKSFNEDKKRKLESISKGGAEGKRSIEQLTSSVELHSQRLEEFRTKSIVLNEKLELAIAAGPSTIKTVEDSLAENRDYQDLKEQISDLEAEVENRPVTDITELRERRAAIAATIDGLKKKEAINQQVDRAEKRLTDLEAEERILAQQLADLEGVEYQIGCFTRAKMDTLEARINSLFSLVRFKLFETQINGGEVECCQTLVDGVPWLDANNAAKINAGLDIINTLCGHYQVEAPIFIDNKESVNELIPIESQVISLVVTLDQSLSVVAEKVLLKELN
jgi:exonuclease SbcC